MSDRSGIEQVYTMSTDRPKRNIIKKKYEDSEGIPWCEERVVRKVLFLSLREFRSGQRNGNNAVTTAGSSTKRHRQRSASHRGVCVNTHTHSQRSPHQRGSREASEDNAERKRPRLQAQRKFAQSQPSSPGSAPLKATPPDPVTVAPANHRPPRTEDFLSYLCLRDTVALPGNMAHLGSVQDEADLHDDEDGAAVSQDFTSCLATNQRGRHLAKKMSSCSVLPSHGRCLRGRASAVQGPERRERPPTSTGHSARASTPNHRRCHGNRAPPRLPQVSTATGLSGIASSSTRRAARAKRTPPLRLLPPRAARSTAPPPGPQAPPTRPQTPPSSRSLAPPTRPQAPPTRPQAPPLRSLAPPTRPQAPPLRSQAPPLHSRSSTSRSKTRRAKKTGLSFRRRHPGPRRPKPLSNARRPSLRRPKSSPRRAPRPGGPSPRPRHRPTPPPPHSGRPLPSAAKPSKPATTPLRAARGRQNGNPPRSTGAARGGALRQSRRRRGLPAEIDSAPSPSEVVEVRLQVSGPRTRSRTLSGGGGGKVGGQEGEGGAVSGRHAGGKVPSKQRHAQRPAASEVLTRQAQASQG